jgi:putative phosphoribosyl transferase
MNIFLNRQEAGRKLAVKLTAYVNHPQAIVLGLPRGGVPVAYEIAKNLNLPLDVCLVRKLGLPQNSEVAMGAIAETAPAADRSSNIIVVDRNTTKMYDINNEQIQAIATKELEELRWRDRTYRNFRPMLKIAERIVILVDDGMATGLTMQAAVMGLRQSQPQKIIVATPVAARSALEQFKPQVDDIVCEIAPKNFGAVGSWYRDFNQTSDRQVCALLSEETQKIVSSF